MTHFAHFLIMLFITFPFTEISYAFERTLRTQWSFSSKFFLLKGGSLIFLTTRIMTGGLKSFLVRGWRVIYLGLSALYLVRNLFAGQDANSTRKSPKVHSLWFSDFFHHRYHTVKFLSKISHTHTQPTPDTLWN